LINSDCESSLWILARISRLLLFAEIEQPAYLALEENIKSNLNNDNFNQRLLLIGHSEKEQIICTLFFVLYYAA